MRTPLTRDQLLEAVELLPGAHPEPGYVIDSDETDDHAEHSFVFCREHAGMVAHGDSIIEGSEMHIHDVSLGEADGVERCWFHGCGVELDTGSLTRNGVNCALALTETDPFESCVTPYELAASAAAMSADDPRWETWERQARRVLAARRRGGRRRAA